MKHFHPCIDCNFCLHVRFSKLGRPNQGCFISENEQRARKRRREDSVNGFVLADFTWDFRALLSHSCLFLCSLFLPQFHLPQLTQHSLALLPVSERLSLVARGHQASRCSLQQVLSSMACSGVALLHWNDGAGGKCEISWSAQSPAHILLFLPRESHKSKTASLLFALHRNPIRNTISLSPPANFFPAWYHAILLPFLLFPPFTLPEKHSHALVSQMFRIVTKENQPLPFFSLLLLHNVSHLCFSFEE